MIVQGFFQTVLGRERGEGVVHKLERVIGRKIGGESVRRCLPIEKRSEEMVRERVKRDINIITFTCSRTVLSGAELDCEPT